MCCKTRGGWLLQKEGYGRYKGKCISPRTGEPITKGKEDPCVTVRGILSSKGKKTRARERGGNISKRQTRGTKRR